MKFAVAILLFVAVASASNVAFDSYLKKYNKKYTGEEYERRLATFQKAVRDVASHRAEFAANGMQPWKGINEFSDMTREEFLNSGRVMRKKLDVKDARSCLANGVSADYSDIDIGAAPKSYDWRTHKPAIVAPVQNQQQCGSCWAFSTVSAIESAYALKHKKEYTKLSEQEIVDCSTACVLEDGQQVCDGGCNGGWPWAAMTDVISWKGLESEKAYPYTAETDTCKRKTKGVEDKIVNYTCLSGPKVANETEMAAFTAKHGPLSIAMDAGLVQSYTSGIIQPTAGECSTTQLDHAINIVGYGSEGKVDYWIVRNSWGATFGEKGYFRIIRGTGACGLNAAVTFPLAA